MKLFLYILVKNISIPLLIVIKGTYAISLISLRNSVYQIYLIILNKFEKLLNNFLTHIYRNKLNLMTVFRLFNISQSMCSKTYIDFIGSGGGT